jgi:hypothetical protein
VRSLLATALGAPAIALGVVCILACGRTQPVVPGDKPVSGALALGLDAGPPVACADVNATWLTPETGDCLQRCQGGAVELAESPSPLCWCPCGFGPTDLTAGCSEDTDCIVSRASCCPCANGGTQIAILGANEPEWNRQLGGHCGRNTHCLAWYNCSDVQAICQDGHCILGN